MPVKRRLARVRRQDLENLNREQERTLLTGSGFFGFAFADDEEFAVAWSMHGARLLAQFIDAHPGERPHAWWQLNSKVPHPPYIDPADAKKYSPFALKVVDGDFAYVTEPQEDYLRRTRQLTDGEIAALDSLDDDDDCESETDHDHASVM